MFEQHTNVMNAQPNSDVELGSMRRATSFHTPRDTDSAYNSARSSLTESYYENHHCDVHIYDDVVNSGVNPDNVHGQLQALAGQRPSDSTRIFPISSHVSLTDVTNIPERLLAQLKVLVSSPFQLFRFLTWPRVGIR